MTEPLISVVIPAYNHELFVGAAVDSVLGQSCADLELIVVDDGSTDRTGEVVQGFTDQRLRYFYQENQDAFNTINRGISLARGRYIAILNSDDLYTLDRLEKLYDACRSDDAVCAFSDVIPIDATGAEFDDPDFGWNRWHRKNRDFYFVCGDLYTAFLKGNFMVTTSNLFMTAEAARRVGPFCSLRYLHDYDFIFRMLTVFPDRVRYVADEKLLYYRIHGGNTLSEAAIAGRQQDQQLIKKYLLAVVPERSRGYVEAGFDRLVELERELGEVRALSAPPSPRGVRPAVRQLGKALKIWINKKRT
ncbi:glycosyltransferase family 2 protein [Desulfofustis glycolicus]|uniref:Glycosyltransferase involved in cell wall bisynthesis n=1 Tax=Desulfofustis glycolicus DSM 9705 TaxID=1121409 RepID=A0A1M5Y3H2_9BACT|nr:glycosyltransferase [Desulfofustis glycolicus]MCB2214869.1 glycosyltransferase [Desulfobulbaceae bacterium]SHI06489.1 Glycosyltransferase involved in cell wall bisynthesis [Desulfofustis glycolicus DSM 9705]